MSRAMAGPVAARVPTRGREPVGQRPAAARNRAGEPGSRLIAIVPAQHAAPRLPAPRLRLENGLRVLHERREGTGIVALELFVDAGLLREARPGLSSLTGRLLEEGTRNRPALELADAIEDVGGTIEMSRRAPRCGSGPRTCRWPCELLADVVRHPVFPAEALDGASGGCWPSCRATSTTRRSRRTCCSAT